MCLQPADSFALSFNEDVFTDREFHYSYTGEWIFDDPFEDVSASLYYQHNTFPDGFSTARWLTDPFDEVPVEEEDVMEADTQDDSPRSHLSTEDSDSVSDMEDEVDLPPTYADWQREYAHEATLPISEQLVLDWEDYQFRMEVEETTHPSLMDLWLNNQ